MATPPTRVSFNVPATGNFSTTTSPKTTAAFDVQAGDLIVVQASVENGGAQSVVTPSASGGSVTWTQQARVPAASNASTAAAWCWTGVVGTTATGITVSLARPTTDTTLWWGFSASVYRNHGGVGAVFNGTNGTGANSAPSVTATCAANSAVVCQVNDWNAADGTTRTWRTINGSPETETVYFRDAAHHTVYGGYAPDTGAAGSITQGLTTPSTMRWVLVGVEILGTSGGAVSGDATRATTSSIAATGATGTAQGASRSTSVGISTSGGGGGSTATSTTVNISASGSVSAGAAGDSNVSVSSSVTTAGTVGKVGSATEAVTSTVTAAGGTSGSAARSTTVGITAAGGTSAAAALATTVGITAAGSVLSGITGDSARATTVAITTTGSAGKTGDSTVATSASIAASGSAGYAKAASLAVGVAVSASGSLVSPRYRLVFPTHEEPMRTQQAWLKQHHLTHALSVVKIGGTWRSMRITALPPAIRDSLEHGVTLFQGGVQYVIDQAMADELAAAGYTTEPIT